MVLNQMFKITVNEDLTSHVVSDDGTQEFFLASHNVLTLKPFTSAEQVEAFINANINKYNWWQPFVDPAVREQERLELAAKAMRSKRNTLIAETDYLALSDNTLTEAMAAYRQALRDITSHANWPNLDEADWPVKPA
jgi:hypothetical protein